MKRAGHKIQRGDDSNPLSDAAWLYSYADMMTQILLFAICVIAAKGLKKPDEVRRQNEMMETVNQVEKYVQESGLSQSMAIDRAADRLVIRMKSAILFAPGQADLTDEAKQALSGLTPILVRAPSLLRVEGHTDNVPMSSAQFPSNWELSTSRALSVIQYLEDHGIAHDRLSVAGYAEFHPLVPNDTPEQRSENRRVEIVVLGG